MRIDWNADLRLEGEVSVGNVSITLLGEVLCKFSLMDERDSGRLARRATAMFPCDGCERMRAIPVP